MCKVGLLRDINRARLVGAPQVTARVTVISVELVSQPIYLAGRLQSDGPHLKNALDP